MLNKLMICNARGLPIVVNSNHEMDTRTALEMTNNLVGRLATELRPKGRGRPQRILTGSWPEDHVHGVIRAVVFRDPSSLPRHIDREDASKLTANRSAASANLNRLMSVHPSHQQSIQVEFFSPFSLSPEMI